LLQQGLSQKGFENGAKEQESWRMGNRPVARTHEPSAKHLILSCCLGYDGQITSFWDSPTLESFKSQLRFSEMLEPCQLLDAV